MKKIFIKTVLCVFIFFGCNEKNSKEYYEDGSLKREGVLVDGKKEGKWIEYTSKGDTSKVELFENDALVWDKTYINNNLWKYIEYKNGVQDGTEIWYYPSGQIDTESQYKNGKAHGLTVGYFESGVVRSKTKYIDGKSDSLEFTQYYPDGNVFVHTESLGHGVHTFYDSIGNFLYDVLYSNFEIIDTLDANSS